MELIGRAGLELNTYNVRADLLAGNGIIGDHFGRNLTPKTRVQIEWVFLNKKKTYREERRSV